MADFTELEKTFDVASEDNSFMTAEATFKYTLYEIRDVNQKTRR